MSSDIAWKNKRDKGTSGYAGSTGSERRDAAKKDLYARGKIDAPTEESLNRYYKRGEGQNTDGGGKANQKRAGSYTNRQSMLDSTIAANQSGMGDKTSANTGSFYGSDSAMPQTQGSNTQYDASRATGPLNTSGQAEEEWRRNFLYNPSDPTYAMQQKLTDMGYKLYSPILRASVLPAAEGLGAAWNLGQATGGGAGSMNPAADFSSFLGSVLTGAGGNGIQGTLQNAYGTLTGGGFADKLRSGLRHAERQRCAAQQLPGRVLQLAHRPAGRHQLAASPHGSAVAVRGAGREEPGGGQHGPWATHRQRERRLAQVHPGHLGGCRGLLRRRERPVQHQ
jgi:hypothetical protein